MTPEEKARAVIDEKLKQSGWVLQDLSQVNPMASLGVAVREYPTSTGPVDYALFVAGKPVGVVEAKKDDAGENITVVEGQSGRYANSTFKYISVDYHIRFAYEATGQLTRFTDYDDQKYRSRTVFSFHRPETLKALLAQPDTVRNNMKHFPSFDGTGFRKCQITAIENLDKSFSENKPKALVQMATGAGKTFTAITAAYRLLKYGRMNRILFLVDTKSLGEQAEREFLAYTPNDDNRSFAQLYGVRRLTSSYKVIQMVDAEKWVSMSSDVKGTIYEELLQKNAEDVKSGAGQYFTPRPLIRAMVKCMQPRPGETISDPCCGSGGFFLSSLDYLTAPGKYSLDREQKEFLKNGTFFGNELVSNTFKMCLMNLYLHNVGDIYGEVPVTLGDALLTDPGYRVDIVLTNPPFGKKSSMTFTNEEGEQESEDLVYNRTDFWTTTSNKQLNFIQHINTLLKPTGRAAVVLPDNVLFEGGAGEIVRRKLLETTDLHTILRLPTGIFYKPGVKANVLFFEKKPASAQIQTREIWYYDFRTNMHFTLKKNPMKEEDLDDFVSCYNPNNRYDRKETWSTDNPDGRFRRYDIEEIMSRDKLNLDVFWIKDRSLADLDNLPNPEDLANDIIENLQSAMMTFSELMAQLANE